MGGSLTYDELADYLGWDLYKKIKNFVETGTYKADTTLMAAKHFQNVYTTEIVPALHNESKTKAEKAGLENITFLLGVSVELLKTITPKVLDCARCPSIWWRYIQQRKEPRSSFSRIRCYSI